MKDGTSSSRRKMLAALLALAGTVGAASAQSPAAGSPAAAGPSKAEIRQIVEQAAKLIEEKYVLADVGKRIANRLRSRGARRSLESSPSKPVLATRLTQEISAVAHDKHMWVRFDPRLSAELAKPPPDPAALAAQMAPQGRLSNFGFRTAEWLPGNVGYLRLDGFLMASLSRKAMDAALSFLGDTDGLIIDLRKNNGGDPATVAALVSYFLGTEPIVVNTLQTRQGSKMTTQEFRTTPPENLYGRDKPVVILTSQRTFSAAEEFAYDMQALKRGTLVGQTTGGGANPADLFALPAGLIIQLPASRAVNPVTGTNWEGVGVKPDVPTASADEAFAAGYERLLNELMQAAKDPEARSRAQRALLAKDSVKR